MRMESGDWISTRPSLVLFSWAATLIFLYRLGFEVVQRSENFSSFSLPSTPLAEPGGLGKLWLAMALAVTDALDGGISLDEGGTRAHGALLSHCHSFHLHLCRSQQYPL